MDDRTRAVDRPFRFFDNREKYLLFVTTCGEKWAIAQRISAEIGLLRPRPPALRLFDAGTGDGTVLAAVLQFLHERHSTVPFVVVGKEISLEDVRLTLDKLPDRFSEHPQSVVVMTNMNYRDAPALRTSAAADAAGVQWHEVALEGSSAHRFALQLKSLRPRLEAQIDDQRMNAAMSSGAYMEATREVLERHDGLWFIDESFVVERTDRAA